MPHHEGRPTKTCAQCGRPFQWRKKWKAVWDEVRYCRALLVESSAAAPRP